MDDVTISNFTEPTLKHGFGTYVLRMRDLDEKRDVEIVLNLSEMEHLRDLITDEIGSKDGDA